MNHEQQEQNNKRKAGMNSAAIARPAARLLITIQQASSLLKHDGYRVALPRSRAFLLQVSAWDLVGTPNEEPEEPPTQPLQEPPPAPVKEPPESPEHPDPIPVHAPQEIPPSISPPEAPPIGPQETPDTPVEVPPEIPNHSHTPIEVPPPTSPAEVPPVGPAKIDFLHNRSERSSAGLGPQLPNLAGTGVYVVVHEDSEERNAQAPITAAQ